MSSSVGVRLACVLWAFLLGCHASGRKEQADASPDAARAAGADVEPSLSDATLDAATEVVDGTAGTEAATTSCGLPSSLYALRDLRITGSGFAEHEGQTLYLFSRQGIPILGVAHTTISNGGFALVLPNGYREGANGYVFWFLDADGDGRCNASFGDQFGYRALDDLDPTGVTGFDIAVSDVHASTLPGVSAPCSGTVPFALLGELDIVATGFEEHEGQRVHLLTRTTENGAVFASGETTVRGGGFSLSFPMGYQDFTYQELDWYVDVDGDGHCSSADHTGYLLTSAARVTGYTPIKQAITDNHRDISNRAGEICAIVQGCAKQNP